LEVFFFFFFKFFFIIHMCIQCLGHFSPLPSFGGFEWNMWLTCQEKSLKK
jgi:hypothetical protein